MIGRWATKLKLKTGVPACLDFDVGTVRVAVARMGSAGGYTTWNLWTGDQQYAVVGEWIARVIAEVVVRGVFAWRISECERSRERFVGSYKDSCPGWLDILPGNPAWHDELCSGASSTIVISSSIDREMTIVGNGNIEGANENTRGWSSERSGRHGCRNEES